MNNKKSFRVCEKCGKRIIERLSNGLFVFEFGRKLKADGTFEEYAPVEIQIHGSVKIKCLSRLCNHWNIFHYFPNVFEKQSPKAKYQQREAEQSTKASNL